MRLSVEIGGTFTDVIRVENNGTQQIFKVLSTPENPAIGALNGIRAAVGDDFSAIEELFHGSTVATNAVIEHKFKTTGLLTTRGFRDLLEIQRQDRTNVYDIFYQKPKPLVSRDKVLEITEMIDLHGRIIQPLVEEEVLPAVEYLLKKKGVESIAVSFLYSYRNPVHEARVKEMILKRFPDLPVTLSCEVIPEFREYERTSTTVLSAYIKPIVRAYVAYLEAALQESKFKGRLFIMQSNGGILPTSAAQEHPAQMFYSGPAAGVMGGVHLAETSGIRNLMTMDMGGTSSDVCLITNGQPEITTSGKINGLPLKLPIIDIVSVGAGGGSIGWIDAGGMSRVGPQSSGANPGPACYGRGGFEPTVTDALVVLGLLPEDGFLGGKMKLHRSLAEQALGTLGKKLKMETLETAYTVYQIALANITQAMRMVSIERGYDPRDYALCVYGGCGPLHGVYLAKGLDMETVLVPPNPGVYSSYGLLVSDFKRDYVQTQISLASGTSPEEIESIFSQLYRKADQEFEAFAVREQKRIYLTSIDMRYRGQGYELNIPFSLKQLLKRGTSILDGLFFKHHLKRYGNASEEKIQIVSYRLSVLGLKEKVKTLPPTLKSSSPRSKKRTIYLQGTAHPCQFWDRLSLPPGFETVGPAIIQEESSATLVPPGWTCRTLEDGTLYLQEEK